MVLNSSALVQASTIANGSATLRPIIHRTTGRGGRGSPITRLMSPGDLGQVVKPFVFLDLFVATPEMASMFESMPMHPHSGIATVTVVTEGRLLFSDPDEGSGVIDYGGVEWMRASGGVWHGKEMSITDGVSNDIPPSITGFQLWVALPPELENALAVSRYIESKDMKKVGPATVIVGDYQGVKSPVPAPDGYNYLLVTLKAGEQWTYTPPVGHTVVFLATSKGTLKYGNSKTEIKEGEMVVFEDGEGLLELTSVASATGPNQGETTFVLGSAIPHPYPLYTGYYSIHTSKEALALGEQTIKELEIELGDRRFSSERTPVFRKRA